LIGVVVILRRRDLKAFLVCAIPAISIAMVTSTNGLERFRLPMMLPLFLMAAYATNSGKFRPSTSAGTEQGQGQPGSRD
jgi:hypothetical protein